MLSVGFIVMVISSIPGGEQFDDPAEYADAQMAMYGVYGKHARHLPHAIPASATRIELMASTTDFLQGEPYFWLTYTLPPEEANEEIRRLRALGPESESLGIPTQGFASPHRAPLASGPDRSACVQFEFGDSAEWLIADAVIDPVNGDVLYMIGND